MDDLLVAALYRFTPLPDYRELQRPLLDLCRAQGIRGTLLLASEGINGTIAGPDEGVRAVVSFLRRDPRLRGLELKQSRAAVQPFHRMKVRLKREIVTMGVEDIDPNRAVGTYVEARDWNRLIQRDDVWLVDTRNDYEVAIGSFRGATDPELGSFREFPDWIRSEMKRRGKSKVAMFCTGGIRCEKSTALLRQDGVEEVYHLRGGILKYLEEVPEAESLWEGECFVFDERVSVKHGLEPGSYALCRACRHPLSMADRSLPGFVEGVSCHRCVDRTTPEQKSGYTERQRQMELAAARGTRHLADG